MALEVVALISGGKDSMFSILHCIDQGHKVVALANLHPPNVSAQERVGADESDLNSFMFQTVGHSIIPLYEKALDLPLYRREIDGTAQEKSKEYAPSAIAGDETEDIYTLLSDVKRMHPEVNAVSTGAILSTYQRTRVESVALRLGLTPLGYLWQYPSLPHADSSPAALLRHMAAVEIDARIVKVASGGLDDSFLWQNLCEERTIRRVQKAVDRFGGSVLGEGGEFETLVITGPSPVWKARLKVDDNEKTVRRADGGEAFLAFGAGVVELDSVPAQGSLPQIPIYDDKFSKILARVESHVASPEVVSAELDSAATLTPISRIQSSVSHNSQVLRFDNIYADVSSPKSIERQTEDACGLLLSKLRTQTLDATNLVHVTVLLRSMSDFAAFNNIYGRLFSQPLPPSRVTISCGLNMPANVDIMISATAHIDSTNRRGLHVQTRSYWAPSNIGPYSQARAIPDRSGSFETSLVFVAGQIPLVPATMERYEPESGSPVTDFAHVAALSLQHLWRIGAEQGVGCWTGAVAFLAPSEDFEQRASIARRLWIEAYKRPEVAIDENDDEVDVWDQRNRGVQSWVQPSEIRALPDFSRFKTEPEPFNGIVSCDTPGFLAVEVAALPRDCSIEWQSSGLVSSSNSLFAINQVNRGDKSPLPPPCVVEAGSFQTWYNEVPAGDQKSAAIHELILAEQEARHFTIYATPDFEIGPDIKAQVIPCRRIAGTTSNKLVAGVVMQAV